MKQRVITGLIFGVLFIPGIILGGMYFYCLSLIITFVSTYELMNMFYKKNDGLKIVRYIVPAFSTIFFCLLNYACTNDEYRIGISNGVLKSNYKDGLLFSDVSSSIANYGFVFIIAGLFILALAIISIFLRNPGKSAINTIFSFVYGGIIMSLALNVEFIYPICSNEKILFKGATFAYIYIVVCFSDMFAYFTGYLFGKHKLCPTISPKKTVEGAIGGTVMASVFGTLGAFIFNVMPIDSYMSTKLKIAIIIATFLISVLISIVSQLGDLFASILKREYEIKDYGNILPGHGGILDRFDSTALAGAFFFVILGIIKLIVMLF